MYKTLNILSTLLKMSIRIDTKALGLEEPTWVNNNNHNIIST